MLHTCSECKTSYKKAVPHQLTCGKLCSLRRNKRLRREREERLGIKRAGRLVQYAQIPKKCECCGANFMAKSARNVFCSLTCRSKSKKPMNQPLKEVKVESKAVFSTYRPKKLKSHSPELQEALDRYTKKRGIVQVITLPDPDPLILTHAERDLLQQLSTIDR